MTDYSAIIPLWPILSGREKFNALARYRADERKRAARKPRKINVEQKKAYDKARREKVTAHKKAEWNPPGGFYPMAEILQRNDIAASSVKRYIAAGKVRVYRVGYHVAVCEYDVILAIEAGIEARRENGKRIRSK